MNVPARPNVKLRPIMGDFTEHPATVIIRALDQLYECSFRTDPAEHTHLMEQAHTAPEILADVIHELFYLRREVHFQAARALDDELAAGVPIELTPEGAAALADSQRPLAAVCNAAVAEETNPQSSTVNRQSQSAPAVNVRAPTRAELEADIAMVHAWNDARGRRLEDIRLITSLAAGTCQQLSKLELLGVLGLIAAVVNRPEEGTKARRHD